MERRKGEGEETRVKKTHNPDRRKEQAHFHTAILRVDGGNNHTAIQLRADAHAHDAKIHQHQRPQPPVHQHARQVSPRPRARMIDPPHLTIMHTSILPRQRLPRRRKHPHPPTHDTALARRQRPIRQPPQQRDAQHHRQRAIHQKHPLEPDEPAQPIHLLKAGTDEPDDGGRDLRGREVVADAAGGALRRVEEGEVVAHAGPHAGDDDAEQEAQELQGPGGAGGGGAHAQEADGGDDAGHPDARGEARHEEVGGAVEEHVRDIEEGEGGGGVVGREVEDLHEVVALGGVHGLREADVGADGGAEEVQDPEGWIRGLRVWSVLEVR